MGGGGGGLPEGEECVFDVDISLNEGEITHSVRLQKSY